MQFTLPALRFLLVASVVSASALPNPDAAPDAATKKTCQKTTYSCTSTVGTLACCTGGNDVGVIAKDGCEPYVNDQSRGICDPSDIYCCEVLAADLCSGADPASASTTQVAC